MENQIGLYMTAEDRREFLAMAQEFAPLTVALRDSQEPQVKGIEGERDSRHTLILWNHLLCSDLERKWIPDPGYFRTDTLREPVLEFLPSAPTTWRGHPALLQGRLFGNFEPYLKKPEEFAQWFQYLAGWIRKRYKKNQGSIGGYVGPQAQKIVSSGSYLLPSFSPPETPEWIAVFEHRRSYR